MNERSFLTDLRQENEEDRFLLRLSKKRQTIFYGQYEIVGPIQCPAELLQKMEAYNSTQSKGKKKLIQTKNHKIILPIL